MPPGNGRITPGTRRIAVDGGLGRRQRRACVVAEDQEVAAGDALDRAERRPRTRNSPSITGMRQ